MNCPGEDQLLRGHREGDQTERKSQLTYEPSALKVHTCAFPIGDGH